MIKCINNTLIKRTPWDENFSMLTILKIASYEAIYPIFWSIRLSNPVRYEKLRTKDFLSYIVSI